LLPPEGADDKGISGSTATADANIGSSVNGNAACLISPSRRACLPWLAHLLLVLRLQLSRDVLRVIGRTSPQLEQIELFGGDDLYSICLAAQSAGPHVRPLFPKLQRLAMSSVDVPDDRMPAEAEDISAATRSVDPGATFSFCEASVVYLWRELLLPLTNLLSTRLSLNSVKRNCFG
jgi:hypothetical protein